MALIQPSEYILYNKGTCFGYIDCNCALAIGCQVVSQRERYCSWVKRVLDIEPCVICLTMCWYAIIIIITHMLTCSRNSKSSPKVSFAVGFFFFWIFLLFTCFTVNSYVNLLYISVIYIYIYMYINDLILNYLIKFTI